MHNLIQFGYYIFISCHFGKWRDQLDIQLGEFQGYIRLKFAGHRQPHHHLFLLLFSLSGFMFSFSAVSALVFTVGGVSFFSACTSVATIVDQMSLTNSSCLAQHLS